MEENQIPAPEKTLLQKVKWGEADLYVYEQLIMESDEEPKSVKFVEGVCNIESFQKHAEKARSIRTVFLKAILDTFEDEPEDEENDEAEFASVSADLDANNVLCEQPTIEQEAEAEDEAPIYIADADETINPNEESSSELGKRWFFIGCVIGYAALITTGVIFAIVQTPLAFLPFLLVSAGFVAVLISVVIGIFINKCRSVDLPNESDGEAITRNSTEVDITPENENIIYRSPLSASSREQVEVEKIDHKPANELINKANFS